jgi:hypothetical protein
MLSRPVSPDKLQTVLSSAPFVLVDGVMNIRTIASAESNYSINRADTDDPEYIVKPFHIFRSAELSHITDTGKAQLRALGIKKVFDLRSDYEISKFDTPVPSVEGVEFVRVPSFTKPDAYEDANIEAL